MNELRDRLLPVVKTLMGRVSPRDYLYAMDQPPLPGRSIVWDTAVLCVGAVLGAMTLWITLDQMGYTRLAADDRAALEIVHEVDPHRLAPGKDIGNRWKGLADALALTWSAVASAPSAAVYPYLTSLTGRPPPEVEPGTGPSVILLLNGLNLYPVEQRGSIIHNLIEEAAALDLPGVQTGLSVLTHLPQDLRAHLFLNDASPFREIVELQRAVDDHRGQAASLEEQLTAERDRAEQQVIQLKALVASTNSPTRACQRHFLACTACLAGQVGVPTSP